MTSPDTAERRPHASIKGRDIKGRFSLLSSKVSGVGQHDKGSTCPYTQT